MIYGYKSDTESMTIIIAGNDKEEYEDFFKQMMLEHKFSESIEMLTTLEMMMDEDFTNISYPVIKVFHNTFDDQEKYIEEYAIKIVDKVRTNYFQEEMQKITQKKQASSEIVKEKLKSEMLGETYVSPSIEEVYGLNIHDPWKKEETDKVNVDDDGVMTEASFGDANTQRNAREQARMDADPNYIPTRKFLGAAKSEDDELSFNALIQIKSKETKKIDGTFTDEEKQEELNQDLDKQEDKEDKEAPISKTLPVYQKTTENTKKLESMNLDYDDNLETSKRKISSFRTDLSVNVLVDSLPDSIKNQIKRISEENKIDIPHFIQEYWYSPASVVDGYCVFPQDQKKFISAVHNMDVNKTITVDVIGVSTKMIKKMDTNEESLILYQSISDNNNSSIEFIVIRIK